MWGSALSVGSRPLGEGSRGGLCLSGHCEVK